MAEVLFYHLTETRMDDALPPLLQKSLDRGWRVVVEFGSEARLQQLNDHLWVWRDDSFLPHGSAADGNASLQPVFLTTDASNPNGANVRFLVDMAVPGDVSAYQRAVVMFDGHDNDALGAARSCWKRLKGEGHILSYWQQTPQGGWVKSA
jgi:DNA polymerase III subunit chi